MEPLNDDDDKQSIESFNSGRCSVADELELAIGPIASDMDIAQMLEFVRNLVKKQS